ncbi:YcxB family protein [Streptomyces sp. NPDC003016]
MDDQGRDAIEVAERGELTYRPTRGDIPAGIRVRDRVRRINVLRGALIAGLGLLPAMRPGGAGAMNVLVYGLLVLLVWSIPHLQAHHVLRMVRWQGEYRTTVTGAGVSAAVEHAALTVRRPLFRGYRETGGHLVLLGGDPNVLCLEVLPKRGLGAPGDVDRLRAILDRNLRRL